MLAYLEHLDHQLFFVLNRGLASPWGDWLFWGISILGDGIPLTLIVGVALWRYDRPTYHTHYVWLVLAVVLGSIMVYLLKQGFDRPRPLTQFAPLLQNGALTIHAVGPQLLHRSFPSGHAQAAAAVSTYLWCLYPRYVYCWGMLLFMVGLSRIYLGVHFPADVVGGSCLGMLLAWGIFVLRCGSVLRSSPSPDRTQE